MDIQMFKERFDEALLRRLEQKTREMKSLTRDPYLHSFVAHGHKLVVKGGKRIRPYLAYLGYEAARRRVKGEERRERDVIDTLVGLELFHVFALMHDDIMDRGVTRHGVATAHVKFGDAQAILIGDLLFNWASEIIAPTKGQPIFAKMVDEVILGQMLDVDATRRDRVTDQFINDKMRLKTASYSFIRPMQFGVALGGIKNPAYIKISADRQESRIMKFCERFGLALGMAFQIQDDLLDLTASSDMLGKSAMNDVKEGQKTVFTQDASRSPKNRALLNRMKGKKLTASDRKRLKKMFEESGAIEYGIEMMETFFDEAERVLDQASLNESSKKSFRELIEYIRERKA